MPVACGGDLILGPKGTLCVCLLSSGHLARLQPPRPRGGVDDSGNTTVARRGVSTMGRVDELLRSMFGAAEERLGEESSAHVPILSRWRMSLFSLAERLLVR